MEELSELKTGVGRAILTAKRDPAPIAVLYSQRSLHAVGVFQRWLLNATSLCETIKDLGLQFDFVADEQVANGVLAERPYKVLFLPLATALADEEVAAIESFAKRGGRVIEMLIETRAKGGALLLNVGPQPDGTLPWEQDRILREVALWHFVNGEAIHNTRPWILTQEGDIWFTRKNGEDTVYAFLTRISDWKRGARKDFVISCLRATDRTQLAVLGQSSEWVEYQPHTDATCRWEQKQDGLHLSVVRAQRLYNDHQWPNPVVVKITHVEPGTVPPDK